MSDIEHTPRATSPVSIVLRILGGLVSLLVAVAASYVAVAVSTNKLWGPDVGIGVVFGWLGGVPLALLIALPLTRRLLRGAPTALKFCAYPILSAILAAVLGPLVIAIAFRLA